MARDIVTFDALDNRKEVMILMHRLGDGLDEMRAARRRARFLQSLMGDGTTALAGAPLQVEPCSAVDAFHLFTAITSALQIPIEEAARKLERLVARGVPA